MKVMKTIMVIGMSVMMAVNVFAETGISSNNDIQKGIEYHNKARSEGMEYAEKACQLLEPYSKTDALACAYYGSSMNILAGFVANTKPMKALDYLQTGGDFLDKAVALEPDNYFIRLIRLENGVEVSRTSPVKRYSKIIDDEEWFVEKDNIQSLPDGIKSEVYLYCAHLKLDEGDLDYALELYEKSAAVDPAGKCGITASKMLEKYSE